MRSTPTADVYGLTIPAGVVFAFGETTHRYTTGDGFQITVLDKGTETVEVEVASSEGVVMERIESVVKADVKDTVLGFFAKYRF